MCKHDQSKCGNSRPAIERHPLNVEGPFYIEKDVCVGCGIMHQAAPELMGMHEYPPGEPGHFHCFVKRQPVSAEELDRAMEAMTVSEVAALRYGGTDPAILQKLCNHGLASQCDVLAGKD